MARLPTSAASFFLFCRHRRWHCDSVSRIRSAYGLQSAALEGKWSEWYVYRTSTARLLASPPNLVSRLVRRSRSDTNYALSGYGTHVCRICVFSTALIKPGLQQPPIDLPTCPHAVAHETGSGAPARERALQLQLAAQPADASRQPAERRCCGRVAGSVRLRSLCLRIVS